MLKKLFRNRKGQGLVEYALIIAGVTLIAAVGISVFGHKVNDMISMVATILPGAHTDDNNPIASGHIIETTVNASGSITIDPSAATGVLSHNGTDRLEGNVFGYSTYGNSDSGLVTEANPGTNGQ
jgi:Flp pilus assembly pilin Flp